MKYSIRGYGLITTMGNTKESFWESLNDNHTKFKPISGATYPELNGFYSSQIKNLNELDYYSERELLGIDRNSVLAAIATKLALKDAGLTGSSPLSSKRIAVVLGTTYSVATNMSDYDESVLIEGVRHCKINLFPNAVMNAPASRVAILHKITGPNTTISSGSNSGIDAIGQACLSIEQGMADAAICGGTEALSEKILLGLARKHLLTKTSDNSKKLLDENQRAYFIPSEGATILLIAPEKNEAATKTSCYCSVSGYNSSFSHFKPRDVTGRSKLIQETITKSLEDSGVGRKGIGTIFIGTGINQFSYRALMQAIHSIFGNTYLGPILNPKKLLGENFAALGPQLVVIAQGYYRGQIRKPLISLLNENPLWVQQPNVDRSALLICANSEGHNSSIIITPPNT